MAFKMKELIAQSGESKSTILYYVKEGLLPKPSKPKPNVYLYDENCVKILRFIKYLQQNFNYSISDIKSIFKNNKFNFDGSFEAIINSLEIISGGKNIQWYDKKSFLELTKIDETILADYIKEGYIFEHTNGFSHKEVEIVTILQKAEKFGLDFSLLQLYVKSAKTLAEKENEVGSKLLEDESSTHDERYALLFELILILKPYIFNIHTVQTHHDNIKKDAS